MKENLALDCSVFNFDFFFFLWSHRVVCGILVPQTGIELDAVRVKCGVLTTGPPRKAPVLQLEATINPFLSPLPCLPFPSFLSSFLSYL